MAEHVYLASDHPSPEPEYMRERDGDIAREAFYDGAVYTLWRRIPVLFLYGEREQDLVARHARFIERVVPNGQQQEIPDAGHFSHVDNPEYIVESIREFLSTLEEFEDRTA